MTFFFKESPTTESYTLSLHDALPILPPDTFTRSADLGDVLRQCLAADADDPHTRLALAHFERGRGRDRKSTRLNSSHPSISYAVFCLKKKKRQTVLLEQRPKCNANGY